jgi:DNA-binding response OmpR family regulator
VVFLDIAMPGMSGNDVARALRARPELDDLVLVALTGCDQSEDRERSFESGFDHHMTKPTTLTALRELLSIAKPSKGQSDGDPTQSGGEAVASSSGLPEFGGLLSPRQPMGSRADQRKAR